MGKNRLKHIYKTFFATRIDSDVEKIGNGAKTTQSYQETTQPYDALLPYTWLKEFSLINHTRKVFEPTLEICGDICMCLDTYSFNESVYFVGIYSI